MAIAAMMGGLAPSELKMHPRLGRVGDIGLGILISQP